MINIADPGRVSQQSHQDGAGVSDFLGRILLSRQASAVEILVEISSVFRCRRHSAGDAGPARSGPTLESIAMHSGRCHDPFMGAVVHAANPMIWLRD